MGGDLGIASLIAPQPGHGAGQLGQAHAMFTLRVAQGGNVAANGTQQFQNEVVGGNHDSIISESGSQ